MIYKFIDNKGTFTVKNPGQYNLYFPLTDKAGKLLSSVSPNLAGDIKQDDEHFLTPPASIEDTRSNLLCRRDFFIRINKKTIRLSEPGQDILEAGFLYHKITKRTGPLQVEILNFIPHDIPVEIMWVRIINKSRKSLKITPTSFIPLYGRAAKNLRDHRHVSSLLNRLQLAKYGIYLKPTMVFDERGHRINKATYFCLGFEGKGIPPSGQFPTLDYFCGRGDLSQPEAIDRNIKPVTKIKAEFNGKEAAAALRFKMKILGRQKEANYFLVMGINSSGEKSIIQSFNKLNTLKKVTRKLENTKKYWQNYLSGIDFDFKDKKFNNWLRWVKFQPTLRKLFGNSFLPHFDYGKGGRGWRDLWQDALTLLLTEPGKAKKLILNNFKGVRIDGSNATIISKAGGLLSDRDNISRVWMDHGMWPYLTLRLYLNKTGDLSVLNQDVTYFRDHLLKRARERDVGFAQKDFRLRTRAGLVYKGSVLEHILIQHLTSFFNVGEHNVIRLENADWNDGLDMAAQKGESVTFSFMYAHNLKDLCGFLKELKRKQKKVTLAEELIPLLDRLGKPLKYNDCQAKQKRLAGYLERTRNISGRKRTVAIDSLISDLEEKSAHLANWLRRKEWLKQGFFNGYYDNKGRRVEGSRGKKISPVRKSLSNGVNMMLPTQVFAIMSGVARPAQIKKIWAAIKKYLKDRKLGGFRLNTDFGSPLPDLGRAFGFAYGDKENGAFFNHMAVMLANALYKRGFIREGREAINSIYQMAAADRAQIYPGMPEYFNRQGKGLYLYLTGSASWYIYTLIEEILGIKFYRGDIILNPKLYGPGFIKAGGDVSFVFKGKVITLSYLRGKQPAAQSLKKVTVGKTRIFPEKGKYVLRKELLAKTKNNSCPIKAYLL